MREIFSASFHYSPLKKYPRAGGGLRRALPPAGSTELAAEFPKLFLIAA
jgi:hypothetical protein